MNTGTALQVGVSATWFFHIGRCGGGERKSTNCPHESLKNHFLGDGAIASYVVRFLLT